MVAQRLQHVTPSRTVQMNARAQALKRQGVKIYNLTAGEPDFPTPLAVQAAARAAIEAGHTRYTPVAGIPELRQALADRETARLGVTVSPAHILVTAGGKQALYNFFMAAVDIGDEVLIPTPCWVSFYEQVRLAGGVPVFIPTQPEGGFFPTVEDLDHYRSSRTRALVINTPNNPSGQVLDAQRLRNIVEWCAEHEITLVFDECYAELTFPPHRHYHPLQLMPEAQPWVVSVHTFSKTHCMTGWRVGWAVGPPSWIDAMATVQSHVNSHPASISQWAALAALSLEPSSLEPMLQAYIRRGERVWRFLARLPGLLPYPPQGAFYVWVDVRAWLDQLGYDDEQLVLALLEEAHVAVIPGTVFQAPGYLRISFATEDDVIEQALHAIETFAQRHHLVS